LKWAAIIKQLTIRKFAVVEDVLFYQVGGIFQVFVVVDCDWHFLSDHAKPANDYHLNTGQRE